MQGATGYPIQYHCYRACYRAISRSPHQVLKQDDDRALQNRIQAHRILCRN